MIRPSAGTITSPYGERVHPITGKKTFHYGEDIAHDAGTILVAPADCTVGRRYQSAAVGNAIRLDMADGITVVMMHLASYDVAAGQHLRRGDRVGVMGATGLAAGVHVHWEVRKDGLIQNPANYITALAAETITPIEKDTTVKQIIQFIRRSDTGVIKAVFTIAGKEQASLVSAHDWAVWGGLGYHYVNVSATAFESVPVVQ
jgi:hypothetical protein